MNLRTNRNGVVVHFRRKRPTVHAGNILLVRSSDRGKSTHIFFKSMNEQPDERQGCFGVRERLAAAYPRQHGALSCARLEHRSSRSSRSGPPSDPKPSRPLRPLREAKRAHPNPHPRRSAKSVVGSKVWDLKIRGSRTRSSRSSPDCVKTSKLGLSLRRRLGDCGNPAGISDGLLRRFASRNDN